MLGTLAKNASDYQVALYIRLSRDDGKIGESESITNQRDLLTRYVKENGYSLYDIYVDDGFSGTNFDRPAFKKMINDIEAGKVNMVITKDLSRLGRDYIGTGEYLERYFPSHNVRYLALTDNIDTMLDQSNLDMAPFKAVFNDMYAKDISKKIRTALKTKQREGKWVGGCPPLGYKIDPEDKNHLVIDEEEAWIVKKIFDLALMGNGTNKIKNILYKEKVPTRAQIHKNNRFKGNCAERGIWSPKTIKTILTNRLYTGDLVQNRRSKINYKIKKTVWNKEEDWIIVENTHDAIIDKETFDMVGKIFSKTNQRNTKKVIRLLDGLLVCYECKHKLGICPPRKSDGRTYIVCNYYRMHSKLGLCTSHAFNYDYLEEAVLTAVRDICLKLLNKEELRKQERKIKLEDPKKEMISKKENLMFNIKKLEEQLDKMYLDKLDGKILESMYKRISEKIFLEIADNECQIKELEQCLEKTSDTFDLTQECNRLINEFMQMKNPTREIMLKLIDRIEVHKDKQLDIYFNFSEMNFF